MRIGSVLSQEKCFVTSFLSGWGLELFGRASVYTGVHRCVKQVTLKKRSYEVNFGLRISQHNIRSMLLIITTDLNDKEGEYVEKYLVCKRNYVFNITQLIYFWCFNIYTCFIWWLHFFSQIHISFGNETDIGWKDDLFQV